MDSVCLLSSTPEIGIFHAVLQIFRHGQNCEFCHIESNGKSTVKSLIIPVDFIFSTHRAYLYSIFISLLVFNNYSRSYKMGP